MKICVFADMEGISGVSGSDFVISGGSRHSEGRRLYTQDINACIKGCFDAGAENVMVRDGHGAGNYVVTEELDGRAELLQGPTDRRFPYLDEFDAVILLGYHAMAGSLGALLEHTYSSSDIQNLWLNGKKVGEIGIDAATAGEQGKPVIMVSGDDKACAEATEWIPGVVTCQVKQGHSCQSARLLPLDDAHELIRVKVIEAVSRMDTIPLVVAERPIVMRVEMVERHAIPNSYAKVAMRVIDARTYEVSAETVEQAFYQIF